MTNKKFEKYLEYLHNFNLSKEEKLALIENLYILANRKFSEFKEKKE